MTKLTVAFLDLSNDLKYYFPYQISNYAHSIIQSVK